MHQNINCQRKMCAQKSPWKFLSVKKWWVTGIIKQPANSYWKHRKKRTLNSHYLVQKWWDSRFDEWICPKNVAWRCSPCYGIWKQKTWLGFRSGLGPNPNSSGRHRAASTHGLSYVGCRPAATTVEPGEKNWHLIKRQFVEFEPWSYILVQREQHH
jgi:hypothetical protein